MSNILPRAQVGHNLRSACRKQTANYFFALIHCLKTSHIKTIFALYSSAFAQSAHFTNQHSAQLAVFSLH